MPRVMPKHMVKKPKKRFFLCRWLMYSKAYRVARGQSTETRSANTLP